MNLARERITGRIVTAIAAAKTPDRQFACPICAGSLIYHPVSDDRVAFFAHRPYHAEPDCPLYFAPHDTDIKRVVNNRAYCVREPALRLQLLSRQKNGYRWQACILIPRFRQATSFSIENSPAYGRVPLSAIREGGEPIPVVLQQADYLITAFNPDEPPERIAVKGFSSVNLFRLSSHLCSRVEGRTPLAAGEAYVVIYRNPISFSPPPDSVARQPLLTTDGWSGFAFILPASPTNGVTKWVAGELDRRIVEQDVSASVVAPVDACRFDDGTWTVTAPTEAITMTVDFGADGTAPPALLIVHNTAGKAQSVSLASPREVHLQIRNPHTGLYQIKRSDNGEILLTVAVDTLVREPKQAGVYFLFNVNGRVEKEYLWTAQIASRFQSVSIGLVELVEASIPPHVRLSFSSGTGNKQQREIIESGESTAQAESASVTLCRAIEQALKNVRPAFEIDAGGFGKLTFPLQSPERSHGRIRMSSAMSARQAWIALATAEFGQRNSGRSAEPPARLRAHVRQISNCGGARR